MRQRRTLNDMRKQQGVALLIVMLLIALSTILASDMLQRQFLDVRRTGNQVLMAQARQYALGAEGWTLQQLARDLRKNRTDSPHDRWAAGKMVLPVEGGSLSGELVDLQSRLNLNNLVIDDKVDPLARERLAALFASQGLDSRVLDALVDWLDSDSLVSGIAGAEDDFYSRATPGYRAANHSLVEISELSSIHGMSEGYVEKLAPWATALPTVTPVNINTAPEPVLLALGFTEQQVDSLLQNRKNGAFASVAAMLDRLPDSETINSSRLGVASRYFLLRLDIRLEPLRYRTLSLIERNNANSLRILWRRRVEV